MLLLKKKVSFFLHLHHHHSATALKANTLVSILYQCHHHLLTNLCFSTSTTITTKKPSLNPSLIVDYLTNSCGLSPEKALKASKHLTHVTSLSKPESVIHFFKHLGFKDDHVKELVSGNPRILCSDITKTLQPKLNAIKDLGFSASEIIQIVCDNPNVVRSRNLLPSVRFWQTMLGSNSNLLKAFKRDHRLATCNLEDKIKPNIAFLKQCGLLDRHIASAALVSPRLITRDLDSLKALAARADEFGVPRGFGMYWYVFRGVCSVSPSTIDAKFGFLRSLGWPEDEVVATVRKNPSLLKMSKRNICDTVAFLLNEAGCELSCIVRVPAILSYSLEKRLIPRNCVLKALKAMELPLGGADLFHAVIMSDKMFLNKFILPHETAVPGIRRTYEAACARKFSGEPVTKEVTNS